MIYGNVAKNLPSRLGGQCDTAVEHVCRTHVYTKIGGAINFRGTLNFAESGQESGPSIEFGIQTARLCQIAARRGLKNNIPEKRFSLADGGV